MVKNNRYISILKFAAEKLENDEYVSLQNVIYHLKNQGFEINSEYKYYQFVEYIKKIFEHPVHDDIIDRIYNEGSLVTIKQKSSTSWIYHNMFMTTDSYQNYIDYKELQEARESSEEARKYAIWALIVSAVSIFITIFLSFHTQTVLMDKQQFSNLIRIFN
jgi:hypothetical protein